MSLIERYVADQTAHGDPMVLDTSRDPASVVCGCRNDVDAEMIARALNAQGAVDDLRKVARLLDRSTQTGKAPTQDEWAALALANATLDRLGGQ